MARAAVVGAVGGVAIMAASTGMMTATTTCIVVCQPGKPPIEGFANWGRNIVQWGSTARALLIGRMHSLQQRRASLMRRSFRRSVTGILSAHEQVGVEMRLQLARL
jgi:hypothetical protein